MNTVKELKEALEKVPEGLNLFLEVEVIDYNDEIITHRCFKDVKVTIEQMLSGGMLVCISGKEQ